MPEQLIRAIAAPRERKSPALEQRQAGSLNVGAVVPSSRTYDRRTAIAAVLPLWPHELDDESPASRRRILAKLHSALRAERRRGVAGHWTYDLARHTQLLRVYREELAALARMQREAGEPETP